LMDDPFAAFLGESTVTCGHVSSGGEGRGGGAASCHSFPPLTATKGAAPWLYAGHQGADPQSWG